jgi:hypothetical protein
MAELECCVPLLKCAEGETTFGERRFGGGEECFCVDSHGLAQGIGVFRMPGLDLRTTYLAGVRVVEGDHRLEQFINSDSAGWVLALLVVALALLGGVREGLRAVAAFVSTWAVVVPVACAGALLGAFLGTVASPAWSQWWFWGASIVGLSTGALAMFVWGRRALALMRVRLWRVVLVQVLVALFGVALIAARSQDTVRAQALISHAPPLVGGSHSSVR